ncbi:hypothetical protein THAOC_30106 [Thalassiosira oceanica]|uniref:Uncharacterized protein n=1 Tax=Thalassiosira oceanica TaxID=159749 RepID=K0RAT6_THAOC|nr:hypothetical protein THAOC_30106 [Thalassiosira oceanica]|eukprot:EJK50793.1 hypothetical protein THAOC_30106 [Thalassiosira oceanica]
MPSSLDYNALAATICVEDITDGAVNQETLRLLKANDTSLTYLCLCEEKNESEPGYYHPGSSEELSWLGHFTKNSTNENLKEFIVQGSDVFKKCDQQSVGRFFEDIGGCNHIETMQFCYADLSEIIYKLGPVMRNNNIAHFQMEECHLGPGKSHFFNVFSGMKSLVELSIECEDNWTDLNDAVMVGCIPALATCSAMQYLSLMNLGFGISSYVALSANFHRMTCLRELDLQRNSINDECVEVLVRGLAECKHLFRLNLKFNMIGDDGLDVLIRRLPASVDYLNLEMNQVTLARQPSLLRFEELNLGCNPLSCGGARIIAASLANPECCLEVLCIHGINFVDEGAAILAESLRCNRRLTTMWFEQSDITITGWNAFSSVLCNAESINATHSSNHTLQRLGADGFPQEFELLLRLNSNEDKSRVAATKILLAHRHLDMTPFFEQELDLLPYVVAWLERFAESRPDLKLCSIFEFVRATPMKVTNMVAGKTKGEKRKLNS